MVLVVDVVVVRSSVPQIESISRDTRIAVMRAAPRSSSRPQFRLTRVLMLFLNNEDVMYISSFLNRSCAATHQTQAERVKAVYTRRNRANQPEVIPHRCSSRCT